MLANFVYCMRIAVWVQHIEQLWGLRHGTKANQHFNKWHGNSYMHIVRRVHLSANSIAELFKVTDGDRGSEDMYIAHTQNVPSNAYERRNVHCNNVLRDTQQHLKLAGKRTNQKRIIFTSIFGHRTWHRKMLAQQEQNDIPEWHRTCWPTMTGGGNFNFWCHSFLWIMGNICY